VDAVGDEVEVLLDGGIRRGSDVVKAMALGARAVLSILRSGMDEALLGLGKSSVRDLSRDDVLVPPDFTRDWG